MQRSVNRFDFILATVSADLPWLDYLAALKPRGKLCIVGVPPNEVSFPAFSILDRNPFVAALSGVRPKSTGCWPKPLS